MSDTKKKYKIYIKKTDEFVEVDKEVYYSYYRMVWTFVKKQQRTGECVCPKSKVPFCDGDCLDCQYHRFIFLSFDENISLGEITIRNTMEQFFEKINHKNQSELFWETIDKLSDEEKIILEAITKEVDNSVIREKLGFKSTPDATFRWYKDKKIKEIRRKLKKFL